MQAKQARLVVYVYRRSPRSWRRPACRSCTWGANKHRPSLRKGLHMTTGETPGGRHRGAWHKRILMAIVPRDLYRVIWLGCLILGWVEEG